MPFTVQVDIRNTGTAAWDPEQSLFFSYRWRSFFGEPLRYEGDRTPFAETVAPGSTARLGVQVDPPPYPGLYQLEWALVWERHGWITSDARQPRLVTVLPAGYDLAIAAVFVMALIVLARPSRVRALQWWMAGAVFTRPLILVAERDLEITARAVLTTALLAASLALVAAALPRRPRLMLGWLAALGATAIVLADVAHMRYFGDVPTLASLGRASEADRLVASTLALLSGWHLLIASELLLVLPALVLALRPQPAASRAAAATRAGGTALAGGAALTGGARNSDSGNARATRLTVGARRLFARPLLRAAAGLALAGVWLGGIAAQESDGEQVFRKAYVVQDLGAYGYHVRDIMAAWADRRAAEDDGRMLAAVDAWMQRTLVGPPAHGDAFGRAAGRNLIVIQAESLQTFVVGAVVNGREITPALNRLRRSALWFPNIFDQTSEGRTSDAEFAALTSCLPAAHGATVFTNAGNSYVALPQILRRRNYATLGAVAFDGTFWNRRTAWPAYGFARVLFEPDFVPGPTVGWGLNDRDFLDQAIPRLQALPPPFFAWLVTLSLHHPFESFPADLRALDLGRWNGTMLGNYLEAMHLFDRALDGFLRQLDAVGLLDDTVVVVFGDHDAGLPREPEMAAALGVGHSVVEWEAADRVPLFILGAAGETGERRVVGGQTDLAPTLLGLLGIDPAQFPFFGRDLLNRPPDRPVLRPYGGWVSARHLYLPDGTCVDRTTLAAQPPGACAAGLATARELRRAADSVLAYDLHARLRAPGQRAFVKPAPPAAPGTGEPARAARPRRG